MLLILPFFHLYFLFPESSPISHSVTAFKLWFMWLKFFDSRQSRMHKRRIDHLECVLKELNPQYYLSVCRQLWYELGETYSNILGIKLQRLQNTDERPTPHALHKVNHLAEQSITNFRNFIESLRDTRWVFIFLHKWIFSCVVLIFTNTFLKIR